jgi:orotate phosphoribosyltransferase
MSKGNGQGQTSTEDLVDFCMQRKALLFGKEFTLKSGRKSPYFFNSACLNTGESFVKIGDALANLIFESMREQRIPRIDYLLGSAYKGIPLVTAVSASLFRLYDVNLPVLYDRKEKKSHGESGGYLVGLPDIDEEDEKPFMTPESVHLGENEVSARTKKQKNVLVIDDVLSSGVALEQSISLLLKEAPDLKVVAVAVLLDRNEKSHMNASLSTASYLHGKHNVTVLSLLKMNDLLFKCNQEENKEISKYLLQFGA